MLLRINHETVFNYAVPASYALLQLRMRPVANDCQRILSWDMALDGAELQADFSDQHGNLVDLAELKSNATEVRVIVSGQVETTGRNGVSGAHTQAMPLWFYRRHTVLTVAGDRVKEMLGAVSSSGPDDLAALHKLSEVILETVRYETGETNVLTTAEDAVAHGSGVCQDHTHIFLSAARALGYPARYISGYLMMDDRIDQEASHAWAEAHVDGLGWVGFDVSNAICPDERYVQIARGLDYKGAAPTTGFVVGAQMENMVVSLQVQQ